MNQLPFSSLLFLIQCNIVLNTAAFIIIPSPQVVGVGQVAVFRCQYPTADLIAWRVNETQVSVFNPPRAPGITIDTTSDTISVLTIVAQFNYNETEVVCIAAFTDGRMSNETTPVHLLIQGPLSTVTKVQRNFSTITWVPPFSLDLTGVDPDIVYCVEVYNITCGVENLVVGDCNVTEYHYVNNRLQQGHTYRTSITPRSNVPGAQNGTNFIKEEMFTFWIDPRINILFDSESSIVSTVIQLKHDDTIVGGIEPTSYFLSLSSIDGIKEQPNALISTSFIQDSSSLILNVNQPLSLNRLWKYKVLALGCIENPVTNMLELSTHEFQNVIVSSCNPGEVRVTGQFISGSSATSVFIIVYSRNNDSNTHYQFMSHSCVPMTTVNGLPGGQYEVSVFIVDVNGLPFHRSAISPRNMSILEGSTLQASFDLEYELVQMSTGVCINCNFLDSFATDCVAVVHQRVSQLSSSGLMNIESSHKFNRSGDTAYGCIEGVNLEQYDVGVIGSIRSPNKILPSTATDGKWSIQIGIFVAGIVLGVILILVLVMIITILIRKSAKTSSTCIHDNVDINKVDHIELQDCGAYEITKPHSQPQHRSLAMDDNPAYGVHQGTIRQL